MFGLHGVFDDQGKAQAADSRVVKLLQARVGDGRVDYGDAAGIRQQLGDGLQRTGVVGAVGARLDHDGALDAEALADRQYASTGASAGV